MSETQTELEEKGENEDEGLRSVARTENTFDMVGWNHEMRN